MSVFPLKRMTEDEITIRIGCISDLFLRRAGPSDIICMITRILIMALFVFNHKTKKELRVGVNLMLKAIQEYADKEYIDQFLGEEKGK